MARPRITADATNPDFQRATGEDVYLAIDHGSARYSLHLWVSEVDEMIEALSKARAAARAQQGLQDVIKEGIS